MASDVGILYQLCQNALFGIDEDDGTPKRLENAMTFNSTEVLLARADYGALFNECIRF